jgi:hypothetical protein
MQRSSGTLFVPEIEKRRRQIFWLFCQREWHRLISADIKSMNYSVMYAARASPRI